MENHLQCHQPLRERKSNSAKKKCVGKKKLNITFKYILVPNEEDATRKESMLSALSRGSGEGSKSRIDTQGLRNPVDSDTTLSLNSTDADLNLDGDDSEGEGNPGLTSLSLGAFKLTSGVQASVSAFSASENITTPAYSTTHKPRTNSRVSLNKKLRLNTLSSINVADIVEESIETHVVNEKIMQANPDHLHSHERYNELYNALLNSMSIDEIETGNNQSQQDVLLKRSYDDQDPPKNYEGDNDKKKQKREGKSPLRTASNVQTSEYDMLYVDACSREYSWFNTLVEDKEDPKYDEDVQNCVESITKLEYSLEQVKLEMCDEMDWINP
ncbi:hypothetical protein Tco_1300491 [Tanacetum coccineum]